MANPTDRYGNPIDKENLDLYDDEDIYETDEKGFVLLPKRLKPGLKTVYKSPLEQSKELLKNDPWTPEKEKWSDAYYHEVKDAIQEDEKNNAPIFNQAEQDERKKAKKRFIFQNTNDNSFGIDGDPSKYVRFFKDYPSAYKYLNETEAKEEARRQALLDRYYKGEGDLAQLHQDILNEHNGNVKAAFEWLFNNANKRRQ